MLCLILDGLYWNFGSKDAPINVTQNMYKSSMLPLMLTS